MDLENPYVVSVIKAVIMAPAFIILMGWIREPRRQQVNAILVATAALTYANHGLGAWEFAFGLGIGVAAFYGLRWYPAIGIAWLLHTATDAIHHAIGQPMISSMEMASFDCAIFDAAIAMWFLVGAPTLWEAPWRGRGRNAESTQQA